jgi:hypothetical protein
MFVVHAVAGPFDQTSFANRQGHTESGRIVHSLVIPEGRLRPIRDRKKRWHL